MLYQLRQQVLLTISHLKGLVLWHNDLPQKHHDDVPYFSQWESPQLVEDILAKRLRAQADPLWQQSGATSADEYAHWSWNSCGMACLKMLLAHSKKTIIPLVELGKECLKYSGYQEPLDASPGLFYKPFCQFVSQEYKLQAQTISALSIRRIIHTIAQGGYVMASVSYEIRYPNIAPEKKGGHLILIIGYDRIKKLLYFHNPSGIDHATQQNVALSFDQFAQFFANKGIIIFS